MSRCPACGVGDIQDGGMSGSYCSTPGCINDYYGGKTPPPRPAPVNDVFMVSFPHGEVSRASLESLVLELHPKARVIHG